MKVFDVDYTQYFSYGAYDEFTGFVVANTESEALGLCLEAYPSTQKEYWTIVEVSLESVGVHGIFQSHC